MKQLGFYEDPRRHAQLPVTPEPEAEPGARAGQVGTPLPSTTCSGARLHWKRTVIQYIPAPARAQSPDFRSYRCGVVQGPWLQDHQ